MRLSTKGRYAVMAMADLAGHAPNTAPRQSPWPWPISPSARKFRCPIWNSSSPNCGAAAWSPACADPAAATAWRGRRTNCASPTSLWRWTSRSPRPAANRQLQRLHQDRGTLPDPRSVGRVGTADPCLSVVRLPGRCGGAAGAGPYPSLQRCRSAEAQRTRGGLEAA